MASAGLPPPSALEVQQEKDFSRDMRQHILRKYSRGRVEGPEPKPKSAVFYRWSKDRDAHINGIQGSAGYVKDGFFYPYNNPTYGENTVFTADSRNGSRGFIQEEMLANYVGKREKPDYDETWHLHTIDLHPDVVPEHYPIKLYKFSPLERIQTPEEWRNLVDDPRYDYYGQPKDLTALLSQVPPLTREDAQAFRRYMYEGEGRRLPPRQIPLIRGVPPKYYEQPLSDAEMVQDPATMDAAQRRKVRDVLLMKTLDQESALKVAQLNAALTHEVQLQGPIEPESVRYHGSVTFRPELWDDHRAIVGNRNKSLREQILPPRATDAIRRVLDVAEAQEEGEWA